MLIGAVATAIFQSSSVFMGLIILLASSGILGLDQVIGFILGAAIGGPTTALVASMSAKHEARKVAVAQSLFNLFGVFIFLPLAYPFEILLRFITPNISQQIVNAQFIFNITIAIICFIFLKPFSKVTNFVTQKLF